MTFHEILGPGSGDPYKERLMRIFPIRNWDKLDITKIPYSYTSTSIINYIQFWSLGIILIIPVYPFEMGPWI